MVMTTQPATAKAFGSALTDEVVRADLERYCALALGAGASAAAIIPASDVPIDERVRLKCVVPR
jgi:hypothetical protein